MQFKNIPAGSFYMGSCKLSSSQKEENKKRQFLGKSSVGATCPSGASADPDAEDDETPQHKVRITKGFQMGVHEVTVGQFKKFLASAGREDLITDDFIQYKSYSDRAAVSYVSWQDAQAFIQWLNKKERCNCYRLPTEAEWEYAARAGTTTRYSWGNSASSAGSYAWYDNNASDRGEKYAHKVGTKKPNAWGLYDMHGNVWEWVQDWYSENYYRNSPSSDPKGPSSGRFRVLRGGSWIDYAKLFRSANRLFNLPSIRNFFNISYGFRILRMP